jgi:hypothetical protein
MPSGLFTALRSSETLNSIANPRTVNPLAAFSDAASAATGIYNVRKAQAQQAVGNALQQATDPQTGVVDYPKAQQIAASMGPQTQMGMQDLLLNASTLRGEQQKQAMQHMSLIGGAALTLVNDPSDQNLEMVRQSLLRANVPADTVNQEIDAMKAMTDPNQRRQYAYQHGVAAMDPTVALQRTAGQPQMVQYGGTSAPTTVVQGSPYNAPQVYVGGGIGHSVSPETYYAPQTATVGFNAQGQQVPANDPTAVSWGTRDVPRGPAMGAPAPGTLSAPGLPVPPQPPGAPGAAPAPPPPPPGTTLRSGYQARPGATPPATTAQPPATAATPAPSTAATPTTAQPPSSAQPAAQTPPPTAGVTTSAPTGAVEQTQDNIKAYTTAQAAIPQQQTTAQTMKRALDVLKYISTGKTQDNVNGLFNFLNGYGQLPPGTTADLANYEEFRKLSVGVSSTITLSVICGCCHCGPAEWWMTVILIPRNPGAENSVMVGQRFAIHVLVVLLHEKQTPPADRPIGIGPAKG